MFRDDKTFVLTPGVATRRSANPPFLLSTIVSRVPPAVDCIFGQQTHSVYPYTCMRYPNAAAGNPGTQAQGLECGGGMERLMERL